MAVSEKPLRYLKALSDYVREDVYAEKTGNGYRPVRSKISSLVLERHLANVTPIGGYLLLNSTDAQCAVLDLDDHDGSAGPEAVKAAAQKLLSEARRMGLCAQVFRSGGGNGVHIWFFFRNIQKARNVRRLMKMILAVAGYSDGTRGVMRGEVEIFPKQDRIAGNGLGNLIALPGARQSTPLDEVHLEPLNWNGIDRSRFNRRKVMLRRPSELAFRRG